MTVLVRADDDDATLVVTPADAAPPGVRWPAFTPAQRRMADAEFVAFATAARAELGRTAWLLTGDTHHAAELVQVALVRTYVHWPRARAGEPLAYARRVLVNARIDTWRRRRSEVLSAPDALAHVAVALDDVVASDDRDEIVRALATLSDGQRRVVVLRYLVGLPEREVADYLDVSVGTVKTQASRGLRRLREELGALEGAPADGGRHDA